MGSEVSDFPDLTDRNRKIVFFVIFVVFIIWIFGKLSPQEKVSQCEVTERIDYGMKGYIIGMGSFLARLIGQYRIHIIFWAVYILYESGLTGIFAGRFGKAENYIVHYLLNISLFYTHSRMMDIFSKGRFYLLKVSFLIGVEIAVYVPLLATLNHFFTDYNQATTTSALGIDRKFIGGAVYRSLEFG